MASAESGGGGHQPITARIVGAMRAAASKTASDWSGRERLENEEDDEFDDEEEEENDDDGSGE